MEKIWDFLDGNKSLIGAILMLVINSDYVASIITNPDLYLLFQSIFAAIFGGGLAHKAKKAIYKNSNLSPNN